jgi:hypothetical protein
MSKDLKPKQRIGQAGSRKKRIIVWSVLAVIVAAGGYFAYQYANKTTEVEVPVAKVRGRESA